MKTSTSTPLTIKTLTTVMPGLCLALMNVCLQAQAADHPKDKTPAPAAAPAGAKIRVAVTDLADAYTSHSAEGTTTYTPPDGFNEGLTEMMDTKLVESGRFIVLERKSLQSVLGEQKLGEGGMVTPQTAAKVGKLLGARYLIGGAITECNYSKSGNGADLHLPFGLGGAGGKTKSEVGLDIRMIDSTTGEIIASVQGKGEVSSSNLNLNFTRGDFGVGSSNFDNSSLGQASRKAIEDAVAKMVQATADMAATPWEGRIADLERDADGPTMLYINAGTNEGLKVGQTLEILRTGRAITDPDTGEVIGRAKDLHVGRCQLTDVGAKLSTAKSLEGAGFQKGDTVRLIDSGAKP